MKREVREVPNGGRIYRLRKWDDHTRVILAHSTALMKASDFVLSNFVTLDASEKEEVAHNIFQTCPSLLVERPNGPVLVTTPLMPPTRAATHAGQQPPPAPGLGAPSGGGTEAPAKSAPKAAPGSVQTVSKCGPMGRTCPMLNYRHIQIPTDSM